MITRRSLLAAAVVSVAAPAILVIVQLGQQ